MLEFSTYLCFKHIAESAFSGSQTELSRFHFSENLSVENSKLSAESGLQVLQCMLILIVKETRDQFHKIWLSRQFSSWLQLALCIHSHIVVPLRMEPMMVGTVHVQTGSSENAANPLQLPSSTPPTSKSVTPCAASGVLVRGSSFVEQEASI